MTVSIDNYTHLSPHHKLPRVDAGRRFSQPVIPSHPLNTIGELPTSQQTSVNLHTGCLQRRQEVCGKPAFEVTDPGSRMCVSLSGLASVSSLSSSPKCSRARGHGPRWITARFTGIHVKITNA